MSETTYRKSGVDIEEGKRLVELIRPMAKKTMRPEVMAGIGSFGALFKLDTKKWKEPVLVSGTDGVGTKLMIAFMAGRHDTVGIDLVAMCVNDILTSGAEPLFFLDYFATGKLLPKKAAQVVSGIAKGCKEAGCALVGGETAEMPGFYKEDEYDLSGFAVGAVERAEIIDGTKIKAGDVLVGVASSGLHSNGYSLVRKALFDIGKMKVSTRVPGLGAPLGEVLLRPTRIYVRAFGLLKEAGVPVKGMAHITGGGITENVPRMLPEGLHAEIREGSWDVPPVFGLIKRLGRVPEEDMKRTFNMGIGFVIAMEGRFSDKAVKVLTKGRFKSYIIGGIKKGGGPVKYVQG